MTFEWMRVIASVLPQWIRVITSITPEWIQAVTSILTFFAAVAAGIFAGKAAIYTKLQAEASDKQVKIAKDALETTRTQAVAAEEHSNHQVAIARETLEVARKEAHVSQLSADRQAEESQALYRRYEESKLDAVIPVVLATARRPGSWFMEIREQGEGGEWPSIWEPFTHARYFEDSENYRVQLRIRLDIVIENVSEKIARVDIVDNANGDVNVRGGEAVIVPPQQEKVLTWTRVFTPTMLATEAEINDPKTWLFSLTLWIRDLGMNVRDVYKFNSDLRFFSRDGSRLLVSPQPEHHWTENVAQPLQQRVYERLETNRSTALHLGGSGSLTIDK